MTDTQTNTQHKHLETIVRHFTLHVLSGNDRQAFEIRSSQFWFKIYLNINQFHFFLN